MAFGSIELTTISRAQDYTTIKHNEDNKAFVDQSHVAVVTDKQNQHKMQDVHQSDETRWQNKDHDAREKGNNEYHGDGGQKRKKQEQIGTVVVKGSAKSFDIKI